MAYQSETRPLCRYCGKPIAKRTRYVFVRDPETTISGGMIDSVVGRFRSRAECQRATNEIVVSVSYWPRNGERVIAHFTTWDGVSWVDEFFCNGTCARDFAYVMARANHVTNHYNAAVEKRRNSASA